MPNNTQVYYAEFFSETRLFNNTYTCEEWENDHLSDENFTQNVDDSKWGKPVDEGLLPKKFYPKKDQKQKPLKPFFYNAGFWFVNEDFANILRQFDMGDGAFYERPFFDKKGNQIEGRYFIWNFGNRRQLFLPEQTSKDAVFEQGRSYESEAYFKENSMPSILHNYKTKYPTTEKPLVVSDRAQRGPAIWKDPIVRSGVFMHADLLNALRVAKLLRFVRIFPCALHKGH